MHPAAYFLIQEITKKVNKKVEEKADECRVNSVDERIVRPISVYSRFFWAFLIFGLLLGGAVWFAGQPTIGLVLFGMCALLSIPGLCIQYNCRIVYDAQGFTWRNVLRISRHYSYEEVTGLCDTPLHVVVELNHKKRLDLDHDWNNQHSFADAIVQYRSKKPPKLPMPVLGMSESEIEESYNGGALSRALLVKAQDLPKFIWFQCVHYGICTIMALSALFNILFSPVFQGEDMLLSFIFLALPGILCHIAALLLYFRFPQYFTAREKASDVILSKKQKAIHKRCTLATTSLGCALGGIFFFLSQMGRYSGPLPIVLAAMAAVLLLFVLLALFRRFSWEYRNFAVGYVTFGVWQVLFCFAIFFTLSGVFLA